MGLSESAKPGSAGFGSSDGVRHVIIMSPRDLDLPLLTAQSQPFGAH